MTEHVHEWKIKRQGLGGYIVIRCEKSQEELTVEEAEARLNATERLSALDAVAYRIWLEEAGVDAVGLRAYADTLEGK